MDWCLCCVTKPCAIVARSDTMQTWHGIKSITDRVNSL